MVTPQFNLSSINRNAGDQQQHELNRTLEQTANLIRTATNAEQKYIIAGILLAFSSDPVVRWMYPDPYQYLTHFPRFVQAFSGKAFIQKTVYCIDGYSGAALWIPPGVELDVDLVTDVLQHSIFESEQADVLAVREQKRLYQLQEAHWYLPLMGIEPNQQGKGYGSALMQHVLVQCDRDRTPAYLEASKPANIRFYERHGFERLGTIQSGASPSIVPMLRQPQ